MAWTTLLFTLAGCVAFAMFLLAIGLRNPRLMLQDYPRDVQAAVPPKTPAERRETILWTVPFLALLFGIPLAAAIVAKHQDANLSYAGAFLNSLVVLAILNLFDWLILDWLVFCTLTPRFVVLPGTEGMAGYRDYALHFRGFLIGLGISLVASALIAALVTLLPL